jgi:predicted small secreted protein
MRRYARVGAALAIGATVLAGCRPEVQFDLTP